MKERLRASASKTGKRHRDEILKCQGESKRSSLVKKKMVQKTGEIYRRKWKTVRNLSKGKHKRKRICQNIWSCHTIFCFTFGLKRFFLAWKNIFNQWHLSPTYISQNIWEPLSMIYTFIGSAGNFTKFLLVLHTCGSTLSESNISSRCHWLNTSIHRTIFSSSGAVLKLFI